MPMTGTRVEWNGIDLRIERGIGALAHYVLLAPAQLEEVVECSAHGWGNPRWERCHWTHSVLPKAIPAYGIDTVERDLLQETSPLRALHFDKGCYLGQEIVERIHSRGNVHRHLRALEKTHCPLPVRMMTFEDAQGKGAKAGRIRSATELPFASGSRHCICAGRAGNQLTYAADAATGTAPRGRAAGTGTDSLVSRSASQRVSRSVSLLMR